MCGYWSFNVSVQSDPAPLVHLKRPSASLDSRMLALDTPLRITMNGATLEMQLRPRLLTLCESLLQRGDPQLAFTCRVQLTPDDGR